MTARALKAPALFPIDRPGLRRAVPRTPPKEDARELSIPSAHGLSIRTVRLEAAPAVASDADEFATTVNADRASLLPWLPWVPFVTDPLSAYRYLEASERDWEDGRACRFSLREKESRRFLGVVSFEHIVHSHLSADFGYWLRSDVRGRGLLNEAGRSLLEWSFSSLGLERVRVAAGTDNDRSLRAIQRLGFRYEGTARRAERCDGRWIDHATFALLRDEFVRESVTVAAEA